MNMIGHQHIGVNPAMVFVSSSGQIFKISLVIWFGEKTRRAVIAALNDMLRYSG